MSTVAHFSLAEYEHMVDVGAFTGPFHRRLELVRGELVEMAPIGTQHSEVVNRLSEWSHAVIGNRPIRVRVQNPIRIPVNNSEPEPDIVWVERRDYSNRHPEPGNILLIIEVADTSLDFDRGDKLAVYAEAGVAEYWIANLLDENIEVYRSPRGRTYQDESRHRGDAAIAPMALPTATRQPSLIFGL